jgi:Ca-activated chloride channel homolog
MKAPDARRVAFASLILTLILIILPLSLAAQATRPTPFRPPRPAPAEPPRPIPMPPFRPVPIPPPHPVPGFVRGSTSVHARFDGSILQVSCEQTFANDGGRLEEVEVLLPIPADAVVTDGLLLADGQEIRAEVLPAGEARAIYEQIVRQRRDPALLELAGHGLVRLSAFPIPPGGRRTVSYRYHQPIPGDRGSCRLEFPIASLCGIDRSGPLEFDLSIDSRDPIVQVYSPTHDFDITRDGPNTADLRYAEDSPDPRETLEVSVVRGGESIGLDLRTGRGRGEDGYFLIAVSPGWNLLETRKLASEAVTFVLDTSGSMEGEKFEQARAALESFLGEIPRQDRFNLVGFSDDAQILFDDGPRRLTEETRREARSFLRRLEAGGGTALDDALEAAAQVTPQGGMILLLTDGQPTVGETDRHEILEHVRHLRREQRFYAFGVGYDVDSRLLDDLAEQGNGSVCYVRPGENVESAVTMLRRRVGHPCATDVRLAVDGARIDEVFPADGQVLYAGEPLIFAGRVSERARGATVRVSAIGPDGRKLVRSWRVDFSDPGARSSAVPVLWASRKAASLIERIREEGRDPRAMAELQELSRRYGILNEEVALLARENEQPLLAAQHDAVPPPSPGGGWQRITPMMGRGAGIAASKSAPTQANVATDQEEFDMSAKTWELKSTGSASAMKDETLDIRSAGEKIFRKDGDVWVDTEIQDPLPKGTRTIRIRTFGAAALQLAAGDVRIASWFAVGERVRVALPGIVIETAPDGMETLSDVQVREIIEAARD